MPGLTHFPSCRECGKQDGHRDTCSRAKNPYQRLEEENNEQRAMINSLDAEVERLKVERDKYKSKADVYGECLQTIAKSHPFRQSCIDLAETALAEVAEAVRP